MNVDFEAADMWSTREFGPKVTDAERAERVELALLLIQQWNAVREIGVRKDMRDGRSRALLANQVCWHLVEAFQLVACQPHSQGAMSIMDSVALEPQDEQKRTLLSGYFADLVAESRTVVERHRTYRRRRVLERAPTWPEVRS